MLAFLFKWDLIITPQCIQFCEDHSIMRDFLEKLSPCINWVCGPLNSSVYFFVVHDEAHSIFDALRLSTKKTPGTELSRCALRKLANNALFD